MKKAVATTPLADRQILEIDAWWRENRDRAFTSTTWSETAAFSSLRSGAP